MYIYLNGEFVKKDEARISPYDHGFLYGLGLFETFRIYNGHPFLLDDHLKRLNEALIILNIQKQFHRQEVEELLKKLLEKNQLKDAYIRLNVSAGLGEIGLQTEPYLEPNLIIFIKPLPPAGKMSEKRAILLKLNRNTPEGLERLKSHHYLNNILAKREIGDVLDIEGIFLTHDGYLAEGIVSNIFWIKDNVLYTPSIETGILNGVTRQFILKLATSLRLDVQEGFFQKESILVADEMFVTNSVQEIVPISAFENCKLPGIEGQWVQKLYELYRSFTEELWTRMDI